MITNLLNRDFDEALTSLVDVYLGITDKWEWDEIFLLTHAPAGASPPAHPTGILLFSSVTVVVGRN